MEGQWNCTSISNDTNEYCVASYTKLVCLYPSQGCVLVQGNELLCWGVHAVGIKAVDSCGGESMSFESGAVDFPLGES